MFTSDYLITVVVLFPFRRVLVTLGLLFGYVVTVVVRFPIFLRVLVDVPLFVMRVVLCSPPDDFLGITLSLGWPLRHRGPTTATWCRVVRSAITEANAPCLFPID